MVNINTPVVCVHHTDYDGLSAGAIVAQNIKNVKYIPMNYGHKVPFEEFENAILYIVDFSFLPEEFYEVLKLAKKVIWLDHHKRSIDDVTTYLKDKNITNLENKCEVGKAGCQLTWEYFNQSEMPFALELIAKYDIWDKEDIRVDQFQCYLDTLTKKQLHPTSSVWNKLFSCKENDKKILNYLKVGSFILKAFTNSDALAAASSAFPLEWEGYIWLCANTPKGRDFYNSIFDADKYIGTLSFYLNKKKDWCISLRADTIDTSLISKKYGGGGHPGSSGFRVKTLPFEI